MQWKLSNFYNFEYSNTHILYSNIQLLKNYSNNSNIRIFKTCPSLDQTYIWYSPAHYSYLHIPCILCIPCIFVAIQGWESRKKSWDRRTCVSLTEEEEALLSPGSNQRHFQGRSSDACLLTFPITSPNPSERKGICKVVQKGRICQFSRLSNSFPRKKAKSLTGTKVFPVCYIRE